MKTNNKIFMRCLLVSGFFILGALVAPRVSLAQCITPVPAPEHLGGFSCDTYTPPGMVCVSDAYVSSISSTESGGNYQCVNSIGAKGRYQFMDSTRAGLCGTGSRPCVGAGDFLHCPQLQDAYFQEFNRRNYQALKSCGAFSQLGAVINGATITQSGLLAAAHLGGAGGACKFVNTNGAYDPSDGHTHLSQYVQKHAGIPMIPGPCPPIGDNYTPPPHAVACGSGGSCATVVSGSPSYPPATEPPYPLPPIVQNDYIRCLDHCNNTPSPYSRMSYYYHCSIPQGSDYSQYVGCCPSVPMGQTNNNPCICYDVYGNISSTCCYDGSGNSVPCCYDTNGDPVPCCTDPFTGAYVPCSTGFGTACPPISHLLGLC